MAEPVGVVVEDEVAASRLVVDSTLRVTIIAVDVSVGATLKGLLTDNCRCTAKNVGWRCREHCCLDVEVNQGVTPVVCNDVNVEHAFCVETTRVEVINSFNRRVVEIERLDVTNDLIIDALLVPCMVAKCCRNSVDGVVEKICCNRSCLFFTRTEVGQCERLLERLWVREVSSVLLVNGDIVNCISISPRPSGLIVISDGTFESRAESEANVNSFASPWG